MSALTDGMRLSMQIEDVRGDLMPYLITAAPFVLLIAAAFLATPVKGWRNKLAVCLVICSLAIVMTA